MKLKYNTYCLIQSIVSIYTYYKNIFLYILYSKYYLLLFFFVSYKQLMDIAWCQNQQSSRYIYILYTLFDFVENVGHPAISKTTCFECSEAKKKKNQQLTCCTIHAIISVRAISSIYIFNGAKGTWFPQDGVFDGSLIVWSLFFVIVLFVSVISVSGL